MKNIQTEHKAEIYYYDIGDYLSREEKFKIIEDFGSMEKLPFTRITPNEHGDWISKRNDRFGTWIAIGDKDDKNNKATFFVPYYSNGVKTQRDAWCYNSSLDALKQNMAFSTDFYNQQRKSLSDGTIKELDMNPQKISWTENVINSAKKNVAISDDKKGFFTEFVYRPFFKQHGLYSRFWNERTYSMLKIFPTSTNKNLVICVSGVGVTKSFSCTISNIIPDLELIGKSQCFPLYWYETIEPDQNSLFEDMDTQIVKHEAISDFILERAQSKYGNKVQREDIFYYVYGILHSKSYRETFEADLKKMLPRIPLVSDYEKFWAFSKAGRDLANLHLNYETVAPMPEVTVESLSEGIYEISQPKFIPDNERMVAEGSPASSKKDDYSYYAVEQMKFPKKGQKDTIIYNHYHTIKNIPEKAYEYVVNGKSAIEWIMERYAVTTDKKSGITNNPNDWSREHNKPRYILDLLLSVINVSVQTVDIVNGLPEVDWDKE